MISDEEIWDNCYFYEKLLEEDGNAQCYYCGGWALFCLCKDNGFIDDETKEELARWQVIREK